jgi:hypothetical protein
MRQNWGDFKQNLAQRERAYRKSLQDKGFRELSDAPRGLLAWRSGQAPVIGGRIRTIPIRSRPSSAASCGLAETPERDPGRDRLAIVQFWRDGRRSVCK